MNYTKSALSLTDQISALQQRGLIISDTIAAERFLNDVSYFRFAAYLRVFEQPDRTIRSGTTFEQVSARSFGIAKTDALESWMKAVNALRNLCAHHARVWNRNLPMRTQLPPVMRNAWVNVTGIAPTSCYAILCCLVYWLNAIDSQNNFATELKSLFTKYPTVNPSAMGFTQNWQQEPLWR